MTPTAPPAPSPADALARDSGAVALWTLVSRVTGFVRIVVIAAVLGPTFLGSTFLAVALLPNLALDFLGGALLGSLLVPSLVTTIDRDDPEATAELAGGFIGAAVVAFGAVAALAILAAPLVLTVLSAGIDDRAVAADQLRVGWVLMALTMPQLALYGLAVIGGAVLNAHGRFALAAAAPVAENIGVIAVMGAVALEFGTGTSLASVDLAQLVLLGLGSTLAVSIHAGTMVWGARRTGVSMVPRAGWKIPAVRSLLRRMAASIGQTSLNSLRLFFLLTVANTVPGGVVAFRLALNFLYLPVQIGARPISLAMLPTLSRLHTGDRHGAFNAEYLRGGALIAFLMVPSAVAYALLAGPLASASSFGEMAGTAGPALVAACLCGLALAVVGESAFQLSVFAAYARHDARTPFVSTALGALVSLACLPLALWADGRTVLLAVGLAYSLGTACSAWDLHRRLAARLPAAAPTAAPSVRRAVGASVLMAAPTYATSTSVLSLVGGPLGAMLAVLAAVAVGFVTFVGVQRLCKSPELAFFAAGLVGLWARRPRVGT